MTRTLQVVGVLFLVAIFSQSCSAAISEKKRELPKLLQDLKALSREERVSTLTTLLKSGMKNTLDDEIIAAINAFINKPEVDPYLVPLVNVNIAQDVVRVNGTLDTVSVTGVSGLLIDKLHVNILLLKADFAFTLPSLVARGNYNIDGTIGGNNLFIFGEGPFEVAVTGAKVSGTGKAGLASGSIIVKSLDLDLSVEKIHFDIQHLMGDDEVSDFLNEMLNDLVPSLMVEYKELIETTVATILIDLINAQLQGTSIYDVISSGVPVSKMAAALVNKT